MLLPGSLPRQPLFHAVVGGSPRLAGARPARPLLALPSPAAGVGQCGSAASVAGATPAGAQEASDQLESESEMLPFALDSEGMVAPAAVAHDADAPPPGGRGGGGSGSGSGGGGSSGAQGGSGVLGLAASSQLLATGYAAGGDKDARVGAFIHMLQEAPPLAVPRGGGRRGGGEEEGLDVAGALREMEGLVAKLTPLLHV